MPQSNKPEPVVHTRWVAWKKTSNHIYALTFNNRAAAECCKGKILHIEEITYTEKGE